MEFNSQTRISDFKFEGNLVLKDVVDCINATNALKSDFKLLKRLIDATKVNLKLSPGEMPLIAEANCKSIEKYDFVIDAVVLVGPVETALAMIYQELTKSVRYRLHVFSTREAAIRWLERINLKQDGKCLIQRL